MKKKAIKALAITLAGIAATAGVTGGIVGAIKKSSDDKANTPINHQEGEETNNQVDINEPVVNVLTVTFELNGGEGEIASQDIRDGQRVSRPENNPTRDGYAFLGWYLNDNQFDFSAPITTNITLRADWIKLHTVTFNNDGVKTTCSVRDHETVNNVTPDEKTGYIFGGWYTDLNDENSKFDFANQIITGDITLYAKWNIRTYMITFDTDEGSEINAQRIEYGGHVDCPESEPSKTGFAFAGWYDVDGHEFDFENTPITSSITIYAHWNEVFQVTFNSFNDAGEATTTVADVVNGNVLKAEQKPLESRVGYTFGGWYTNAEFNGNSIDLDSPITSNMELYAKWDVITFTVTYHSNGGSDISERVNYGATLQPTNPLWQEHTFAGWYADANFTTPFDFDAPITENKDVYAKWNVTVTFDVDGGNPVSNQILTYNTTLSNLPETTKTGHNFGGWWTDSALTQPFTTATQVAQNMTVYAKWNIISYTVTFAIGNDATLAGGTTQQVNYNGHVNPPATPTRDGFEFAGWYANPNFTGEQFDFANAQITDNTTIYAKWDEVIVEEYEYEYDDDYEGYTLRKYNGSETNVVIPDEYEGKPVTGIGESAFQDNQDLETITIGANVAWIGDSAFANTGLTSVEIPDSVYSIGNNAFQNSSLETITLGENVESIYHDAFANTGLTFVEIPDSVVDIGEYAFQGCPLENVIIGNGVQTIGEGAFCECDSLTEITIPGNVKTIGEAAFGHCSSLEKVIMKNGVETIGNRTFEGCDSLITMVIPSSVTYLNPYHIFNDEYHDNLTIYAGPQTQPDTWNSFDSYVDSYAKEVFWGNEWTMQQNDVPTIKTGTLNQAEHFVIRDNKLIGLSASGAQIAANNGHLNVVIPNNVTEIYGFMSGQCANTNYSAFWEFADMDNYMNSIDYGNKIISVNLPEGLTTIGVRAFYGCDKLTSINIPSSVTTIGDDAFANCSNLNTVTFAENSQLQHVGWAFEGISIDVILPNGVQAEWDIYDADEKFIYGFRDYTYFSGIDALTIKKYIGNEDTVVIPEKFNGYNVHINGTPFADTNVTTIYCYFERNGYENGYDWIPDGATVYFQGEWEYKNGVPTPNN